MRVRKALHAAPGAHGGWGVISAVKALMRDYAYSDNSDPVFPFARHKDW